MITEDRHLALKSTAIIDVSILWTIGIVLVVIGAILWILGSVGRAVGGRRHYW